MLTPEWCLLLSICTVTVTERAKDVSTLKERTVVILALELRHVAAVVLVLPGHLCRFVTCVRIGLILTGPSDGSLRCLICSTITIAHIVRPSGRFVGARRAVLELAYTKVAILMFPTAPRVEPWSTRLTSGCQLVL